MDGNGKKEAMDYGSCNNLETNGEWWSEVAMEESFNGDGRRGRERRGKNERKKREWWEDFKANSRSRETKRRFLNHMYWVAFPALLYPFLFFFLFFFKIIFIID